MVDGSCLFNICIFCSLAKWGKKSFKRNHNKLIKINWNINEMTSNWLHVRQLCRKSPPEYNVCADSDFNSIALCHFAFFHPPLLTETFPLVLIMLLLFITAASGNPFLSLFHLCLSSWCLLFPSLQMLRFSGKQRTSEEPKRSNKLLFLLLHGNAVSTSFNTDVYCRYK